MPSAAIKHGDGGAPEGDTSAAGVYRLDARTIARRAASGAVLLTVRGILQQGLGFASTVVVTRLLAPDDVGIVALALAISAFASMLAGGQGMAGALIRRETSPDRSDLEALVGLQLVVTTVLVGAVMLATAPFGVVGQIAAVMVAPLPLAVFRAPGTVILERELSYRRMTTVETAEMFAYYGWTIGTVVAGWGIWGLATAVVVRTCVGTAFMAALTPHGLVRPRFDRERSRALVGIGVRVQAVELLSALRDQVLLSATAAMAGLTVVGFWNLAVRLLQVPGLIFTSLLRVSFPAMSRLHASGEDPARTLPTLLPVAAVLTGILLAPLAAAAPVFVPLVFGERWAASATAIPVGALALVIVMPFVMTANGYLWAVGDASTPLHATVADSVVFLLVGLSLVGLLGPLGIALGLVASSLAHAYVLARGVRIAAQIDVVRLIGLPTVLWVGAAGAGWGCAHVPVPAPLALVAAVVLSVLVYVALLIPVRATLLHDAMLDEVPVLRRVVQRHGAFGGAESVA